MSQSPNRDEAQSPRSTIAQSHFNYDNYNDDDNNSTTSSTQESLPRRGPYRLQSEEMDIHQLRFENDGLYGQNDQLQEINKKLEAEVKSLKSKLSNANAHTEQGNAAFARLEKAHNLLQAAHSKVQETCKAELDDLKHKYRSLAGSVSGTDKAKGRMESALAEAKNQLKMSQDRNSYLEDQLARDPTTTEKHFEALAEEISTQMQGLQEELASLQKTIRNKDTQINDLKAVNKKEKNENRNMSRDISELKTSKAKLLESFKRTEAELALLKAPIPDGHANPENTADDDSRSEMSCDKEATPGQLLGCSLQSEIGGSINSRGRSPTKSVFGASTQSDLDVHEGAEEAKVDEDTITWTTKDIIGQIDARYEAALKWGAGGQTAVRSNEASIVDRSGAPDGLFDDGEIWHAGRLPAAQSSKYISENGLGGTNGSEWVADKSDVHVLAATQGSEHNIDNGMGGNDVLFGVGDRREVSGFPPTHTSEDTTRQTTKTQIEIYEVMEKLGQAEFWSRKMIAGVLMFAFMAMVYMGLCYFNWSQGNAAMKERSVWTKANMIGNGFEPGTMAQIQRQILSTLRMMDKDALARAGWFPPTKTFHLRPTMTIYVPAASAGPR
ncbi:hypothetical protein N7G274_003490 [Stereocaulon virgatum]|uniref:Uncharacterized protein n=1 Tax=Stereocaulon virgatum TaxID=373712 RepID=A0ABR4ADX2_9LECA